MKNVERYFDSRDSLRGPRNGRFSPRTVPSLAPNKSTPSLSPHRGAAAPRRVPRPPHCRVPHTVDSSSPLPRRTSSGLGFGPTCRPWCTSRPGTSAVRRAWRATGAQAGWGFRAASELAGRLMGTGVPYLSPPPHKPVPPP